MEVDDDDDDANDVDYDPQMADANDVSASPIEEQNMFDNDDYDEKLFDFDVFEMDDDYDGYECYENSYEIR
jgi:hypothetical protein